MFFQLLILVFALSACQGPGTSGLWLDPKWQVDTVAEAGNDWPDMQVLSADGRFLYQANELPSGQLNPSVTRIDLQSGTRETLLYGLERADGLKLDPNGDLWVGEEATDGLVWRLQEPALLPAEQRVDRQTLISSDPRIQPVMEAGRMAHEGLVFSTNGSFLYLADERVDGCLYRLSLGTSLLQTFSASLGWLNIIDPVVARIEAKALLCSTFVRLEDMERLPDGRIFVSETGKGAIKGRILEITDGMAPQVTEFLNDPRLHHPDNLEWDATRNWLWISDDDMPSRLWAWDGVELKGIARDDESEITGIESSPDGSVFINLQHRISGPDLTLRISQR